MKTFTRLFWFGALILVLVSTACAPSDDITPTALETTVPLETDTPSGTDTTSTAETATTETADGTGTAPTSETLEVTGTATISGTADGTSTAGTLTPGIPVTGLDITLVDCQFCVDTMAHAMLIMPDTASFQVTSTTPSTTSSTTLVTTCTTIEVSNGKQVVYCTGPETSPITLNICNATGECMDFPIELMDCPDVPANGTAVPNQTLPAGTASPTIVGPATGTPTPAGAATATATP